MRRVKSKLPLPTCGLVELTMSERNSCQSGERVMAESHLPSLLAVCSVPLWPLSNGYSLRVSHILQELARRWSITLIAPPSKLPPGIYEHVAVKLVGNSLTYPWRFDQTGLRAAVDHVTASSHHDRALVWAGAEAVWFGRSDLPPAVIDVIDCNPLEFWRDVLSSRDVKQRFRSARELGVAASFTRRTVRSAIATVCVGEADARWLRWIGGRDTVHVVPNGVEIPAREHLVAEDPLPTLIFTGSLGYRPNVEAVLFAAKSIWPRVLAAVPNARFVVAGRGPAPEVRALAGLMNIEVVPDVPDMAAAIGRSWVSIAPMRSGVGIKNKILEAWACARPVVMTRIATNGLIVPTDHAALVCQGADTMSASVIRLFADARERVRLGQSARYNVERHFTWAMVAARLDALLRRQTSAPSLAEESGRARSTLAVSDGITE